MNVQLLNDLFCSLNQVAFFKKKRFGIDHDQNNKTFFSFAYIFLTFSCSFMEQGRD